MRIRTSTIDEVDFPGAIVAGCNLKYDVFDSFQNRLKLHFVAVDTESGETIINILDENGSPVIDSAKKDIVRARYSFKPPLSILTSP